jgi:translation initiation factor 2B subunit (eIF-2B alpha/beta/delta family)
MTLHSSVVAVIDQLERQELHAARSGRALMAALADTAVDSPADSTAALAGELEAAVDAVLDVLPAYAPPINVMHQVMLLVEHAEAAGLPLAELRERLADQARAFSAWAQQSRPAVATHAAQLIRPGATVFTHTLSETILATLAEARRRGSRFRLLVTESRPNQDGLVTAARAHALGIGVQVGIDACLSDLIPQADLVLVGAEAILADGSAICKVGTYPAALVAHSHGCPVYVVVDTYKFNASSLLGLPLWLDPLSPGDVIRDLGTRTAAIVGHLFDVTPPGLIRGIVTERGLISPASCADIMGAMPLSARLGAKLAAWYERKQATVITSH